MESFDVLLSVMVFSVVAENEEAARLQVSDWMDKAGELLPAPTCPSSQVESCKKTEVF